MAFKHLSYITGNKQSDLIIIFLKSLSSSLPILIKYIAPVEDRLPFPAWKHFPHLCGFYLRLLGGAFWKEMKEVGIYHTDFAGGTLLYSMWDLSSQSWIKPVPLLLKCGLLTIGPQREVPVYFAFKH